MGCRKAGFRICPTCLVGQEMLTQRSGLSIQALGPYEGLLRRAVLRLKDSNDRILERDLGRRLARLAPLCQAVVGVPTSGRRQRWRGYCLPTRLAGVLAEARGIAALKGFSCLGDPLPRKQLRGLRSRRESLTHFRYPGRLHGKILLVDDVVTSGQTMLQARQALLEAGADRVELLCLAASL